MQCTRFHCILMDMGHFCFLFSKRTEIRFKPKGLQSITVVLRSLALKMVCAHGAMKRSPVGGGDAVKSLVLLY